MKGCVLTSDRYKRLVRPAWCILILITGVFFLAGCETSKKAAIGYYRVVTAPTHFVIRKLSEPSSTPTPTDVTTPGHPVAPSPSPARTLASSSTTSTTARKQTSTPAQSPRPVAAQPPQQQLQFPTAKPVPDRPGYVYSPSDPSKYVDVSGYAAGSKVKDPYSGKIFLVP